tara:strand:+ start:624 stop:2141 length:1518 start_codon:yes stop_codon:yes gene_type:complete
MAIKRYFATKDNTITNSFKADLVTRGTGSNMGQADILEVFSIYGQATTSSIELERFIVQFNTTDINSDRDDGLLPASGSLKWYLKLFNARGSTTLPRDFTLNVHPITATWEEGFGLDMDNYTDITYDVEGSNWVKSAGNTSWTSQGGAYLETPNATASFPVGNEDMVLDVTTMVEDWLGDAPTRNNYGFIVKLPHAIESGSLSYYTKKFFARGSEYFFKRPVLEARWDNRITDNRGDFYLSSSLVPAEENINTLYLYNFVRGKLRDIPGLGVNKHVYVSLFSGTLDNTAPTASALQLVVDGTHVKSTNNLVVTGGIVSTGIYSASVAFTGSSTMSKLFDVWFTGSLHVSSAVEATLQFHTGSIDVEKFEGSSFSDSSKYFINFTNLQDGYYPKQSARFRMFARKKGWSPNIYTVAQATVPTLTFESASYQISRVVDDYIVIPYGTGSMYSTLLSYDVSGNYFDLDMEMLEPGFSYNINVSIYDAAVGSYIEQPYHFKFKVNEYDY